ncbi:MAG: hypothetical protein GAK43_02014 [Stenotrophomonas maltophilia]|nr:MAG: hypothetical protein GAK43_02014 [Stenotrophomonas maltophilia]
MSLNSVVPVRRARGSWVYRLLLLLRRPFAWIGPLLALALLASASGCAWMYFMREAPGMWAGGGALGLALELPLLLLWGEYDWWLYKLGPRDRLEMPL